MAEDKSDSFEFKPLDVGGIIKAQNEKMQQFGKRNPIVETVRDAKISPYIQVSGSLSEIQTVGAGNMFTDNGLGVFAFCGPSNESIKSNQPGQDNVSIAVLDSSGEVRQILLVEADGVGQAYSSEFAAGVATRFLAENGTSNLVGNLTKTSEHLQQWHTADLAAVTTNIPILDQALDQTRRQAGSRTTLNQILVTPGSGDIKGYFHGDGEVVVVRSNGDVERTKCAEKGTPQIGTKDGVVGSSVEFISKLNGGDTIFLFSDGLDKLENSVLVKLSQDVDFSNNTPGNEHVVQEIEAQPLRDDDISLIVYKQK